MSGLTSVVEKSMLWLYISYPAVILQRWLLVLVEFLTKNLLVAMKLRNLLLGAALSIKFAQSKGLWASTPAAWDGFIREAYPVGNGKMGGNGVENSMWKNVDVFLAMPFGNPGSEKVVLNIDSLWSGGPFENAVSSPAMSSDTARSPRPSLILERTQLQMYRTTYQQSENSYLRMELEVSPICPAKSQFTHTV